MPAHQLASGLIDVENKSGLLLAVAILQDLAPDAE